MKSIYTLFGSLIGIVILFALLAGGYFLLTYVVGLFTTLEPPIRTLAAIASVVILLSAVIVAQGSKAHGLSQRAEKTATTYEQLLSVLCAKSAAGELSAIERSLALEGGAKVISAYVRLKNSPDEMRMTLLKTLLVEMRADLGRSDIVRKDSDLLELLEQTRSASHATHRPSERMAAHE